MRPRGGLGVQFLSHPKERMGKKESVRALVLAFFVFLALYFFLRWAWGTEGFYAEAPAPAATTAGNGLQINKSTMTSKYGEFAKVVPKSEDYIKPYGMIFPAVEAQQICTSWGQVWGLPYSWKMPAAMGGSIAGLRLHTPRVCKYVLGGTYVDIPAQFKQLMETVSEKDILPDGYGVCIKDIQLGSGFNNQVIKNANMSEVCNYLNYTTPAF